MTARATKTTLAFGLVTADVALYRTAVEQKAQPWDTDPPREKERSREFTPPPGPLAVVPTGTKEGKVEVPTVRKGIRKEDDTFVDLTEGIEQIEEATKLEEMRVADFIRTEEVHRARVTGSYYIAPQPDPGNSGNAKVLRLLRDAMRVTKRVAVVKFTKRTKQSLGVIVPHKEGLILVEVSWAEDVRLPPAEFNVPGMLDVTDDEIGTAVELVHAMSGKRADSLDALTDDARQMRSELIAKAEAGETFTVRERLAHAGGDVVELMQRGVDDREALREAAA